MPTIIQRLANLCAAETRLTRTGRIDRNKFSTSVFSFVANEVEELRPSGIRNAFGETTVSHHPFDIQILDRDKAVIINKPSAQIVVKVRPLIPDVNGRPSQKLNRLAPAIRAFLASCNSSRRNAELSLRLAEVTGVMNLGTVRERGEVGQANIDANHLRIERERLRQDFTDKQSEPPSSFPLDGESLNSAFNRTVQFDANVTDFREAQFVAVENSFEARSKRDGVVAAEGTEPGIASFLSAFDSAEEVFKCVLHSFKNIEKGLRVYVSQIRPQNFNGGHLVLLVNVRNRFAVQLPSVPSLL